MSQVTVLLPALHPPAARYGTVARQALLDRLHGELQARLVLITAPAGWGKTSLLRDWCASGEAPLRVLRAPGDKSADSALPPLINDLARLTDRLTLVIDDLHVITNDEIAEWFRFLVDQLPPTLGLIAATRSDPALPTRSSATPHAA